MVCVIIFYIDRASLGFHVNFVLCSIEIRNVCGIIKKFQMLFVSVSCLYLIIRLFKGLNKYQNC